MMHQPEIDRLVSVLRDMPVRFAVLFGSHAKGKASPQSDIDLVVQVDEPLKGIRFYELLDRLTAVTGADIDLFEAGDIIPGSPMAREIQSTGRLIYDRENG